MKRYNMDHLGQRLPDLHNNDDVDYQFPVVDEAGTVVDLTGFTFSFRLGEVNTTVAAVTITDTTIDDATGGLVTLHIDTGDLSSIGTSQGKDYYWLFEIISPGGAKNVVGSGLVNVTESR